MAFKVGQKVVCVDDSPGPFGILKGTMKNGLLYTILGFNPCDGGLILLECTSKAGYGAWRSNRFKPVELDYDFVEEVIKQVTPKELEA